ncbi:hAT dimerization domain-containing protein [Abeliophyllum distichum]|uniref:HAT dimerization domain-containing protein n=1 Tax=Abeliophyllum distichum TaxID=126358 RepID=A0ABD1SWN4_9LAMI
MEENMANNLHDEEIHPFFEENGKASVNSQSKGMEGRNLDKQKGIGSYFMPRTGPDSQSTIKIVLQSKEAKEKCDLVISKWMIDASIPFNAVNSVYYQQSIDAIASMEPGYKGPNFHSLRGFLLSKNVEKVRKYIESYRTIWKSTGCTIMADGWTDQCKRTLINFLVYCPKGTIFFKNMLMLHMHLRLLSCCTDCLEKLCYSWVPKLLFIW